MVTTPSTPRSHYDHHPGPQPEGIPVGGQFAATAHSDEVRPSRPRTAPRNVSGACVGTTSTPRQR
jgi:hypothetical protein